MLFLFLGSTAYFYVLTNLFIKLIRSLHLPKVWLFLSGFMVLMTLFPTLRAVIIGKENAVNLFQYLVAAIPDLLIVSFFIVLAFQRKSDISRMKFSRLDVIMLVVFGLNVLIGSLLSAEPKLIILGLRLTYLPVLFYFVARLIYSGDFFGNFKIWLKWIMAWFTFMALFGLILYYFIPGLEKNMNDMVGGIEGEYFIKRLNSIFYSPTVNGMFCCLACVYYIVRNFEKIEFSSLLFLSINFWGLLLSVSRGGIIAFFLILVIAILINRNWKNIGITVSTLTIVFFLAIYSVGLSLSNFSWVFSSTAETIGMEENVSRVELWKRTFEDLKEKPFGYGIGKSGWIAYRFLKGSDEESAYLATDGWYLKAANETGIFGLISYLFLLGFILFRFLKENERKGELLFILLFIFSVLLINLVSNVFDYFLMNTIIWFLIGVAENNITRKCEVCEN